MEEVETQQQSLKALRDSTQSLLDCKANLVQKIESLDHKEKLLDEIVSERQRLTKEKRKLLEMIQSVQRDIEAVAEAESSLGKERDELKNSVERIQSQEYDPLHDQVNELRGRSGLQKLPHVQQELEAQMARALQERRENWQHASPSPAPSPSQPIRQINTVTSSSSSFPITRNTANRSWRRR
ncbi:hypothetical protein BDB00DRAFT_39201 [Zychaea mexicana]|uniref:uncharacterized protein n=1 Tax=Zychaea mexicana TaxID=64656 RepID=UPI0022FE557E|nr:uncharacterized protein BDB00DRAFT_39201 [Zychaea mexicana]KAI9488470.1 hypothetical protein BDB00DRAFT_39201 [Zychaea mexicana]